jgi:hypothetical protein
LLGKAWADAEPGVANLANKTALTAQKLDFLLLAKSEFAKSMGDFRRGGKLFDANGRTRPNPAQRAQEWLEALLSTFAIAVRLIHAGKHRPTLTQLQAAGFRFALSLHPAAIVLLAENALSNASRPLS